MVVARRGLLNRLNFIELDGTSVGINHYDDIAAITMPHQGTPID